eukprot:gene11682-34404_t
MSTLIHLVSRFASNSRTRSSANALLLSSTYTTASPLPSNPSSSDDRANLLTPDPEFQPQLGAATDLPPVHHHHQQKQQQLQLRGSSSHANSHAYSHSQLRGASSHAHTHDSSASTSETSTSGMSFDLDAALLEKRYKALQWQLHPDKAVSRPSDERENSTQQAMMINNAYNVLKTPLTRANYILAQRGVKTDDESTISDPEFLMEVMEAREEADCTEDPATLSAMLASNLKQQAEVVKKLSVAFSSNNGTADAIALTTKLTYLSKLDEVLYAK